MYILCYVLCVGVQVMRGHLLDLDVLQCFRRYFVDMELIQTLVDSCAGTAGLLFGAVAGTIKSETPRLFAVASSLQWAALGSTFWLARGGISYAWKVGPMSPPQDRLKASATAGAVTGGLCGGALRGHRNIIPGAIMFTFFGYLGQSLYNLLDVRHTEQSQQTAIEVNQTTSLWRRVANSKYSPMKVLSDEEYENVLRRKLLQVEAEISVIDDDIEKLKAWSLTDESENDKKFG